MDGERIAEGVSSPDSTMGSGRYFSGQLFVHSKMILADDRVAVVASANVNDRSMHGERDTELGVVLRASALRPGVRAMDPAMAHAHRMEVVASRMGGSTYHVSRAVKGLRMRLWREWLGMPCDDDAQIARILTAPPAAAARGGGEGAGSVNGSRKLPDSKRLPPVLHLSQRVRFDGPGGPGACLRPHRVVDSRSAAVARAELSIEDATAEEVYHTLIRGSAIRNRAVLEAFFADTPRDSCHRTIDHASAIAADADPDGGTRLSREQEERLHREARGYLVTMSEGYLDEEDLAVQLHDPEMVVPTYMMQ